MLEPLPCRLRYLFAWFVELSGRRASGGFGMSPLSFPDIESWARLTGRELDHFEVSALCRLDDTFLRIMKPDDASK